MSWMRSSAGAAATPSRSSLDSAAAAAWSFSELFPLPPLTGAVWLLAAERWASRVLVSSSSRASWSVMSAIFLRRGWGSIPCSVL